MINNKYPLLSKAIEEADLIEWTGNDGEPYLFRLFSFGEKGSCLDHHLIKEIKQGLVNNVNGMSEQPKYVLTITEIGTAWGMLVSDACSIDIIIGRNNPYLEKYSESTKVESRGPHGQTFYLKGVKSGDTVVILDDVVSTAKNITAAVNAFVEKGIRVIGIMSIVTKGESYKEFESKFSISVKALVNLTSTGTLK